VDFKLQKGQNLKHLRTLLAKILSRVLMRVEFDGTPLLRSEYGTRLSAGGTNALRRMWLIKAGSVWSNSFRNLTIMQIKLFFYYFFKKTLLSSGRYENHWRTSAIFTSIK
jgi:hypothetical protein